MKELRSAILTQGEGFGNDTVKVDMFFNHRIDTGLLFRMGEEMARRFADAKPDIVLTVEASGIALAMTTAHALGDIPVVFAKKSISMVQNGELAQAKVYSFTYKRENVIRVEKKCLPMGSRVLIVDDFLADGQTCQGLMAICAQTGCRVVGIGVGIEKGFMSGGKNLREMGAKLSALAVIKEIKDGQIILADD